jgi:hypothetical protein
MSEQTLTAQIDFSVFGAVKGIVTKSDKPRVEIPETLAKGFADIVSYLATPGVENTNKISMEMPTEAEADTLRAQVQQYADDNGLSAYIPKWADAHWSRKDADQETGIYGTDPETGKALTAKWIPANGAFVGGKWKGVSKSWNVDTNVTFRITHPKPKDDSPTVDTTTVTTTQSEAKPATPASRGRQILAK